jgi:hypothetical protein
MQHASELELLLQHNSLPSIEHLEVTNEDLHIILPADNEKSILNIQSNDVHLRRERIDGIRLTRAPLEVSKSFSVGDIMVK